MSEQKYVKQKKKTYGIKYFLLFPQKNLPQNFSDLSCHRVILTECEPEIQAHFPEKLN